MKIMPKRHSAAKIPAVLQLALLALTLAGGARTDAAIIYSGADRDVVYQGYDYPAVFSLFDAPGVWDDIYLTLDVMDNPTLTYVEFMSLQKIHGNQVDFAVGDVGYAKRFAGGDLIDGSIVYGGDNYESFSYYMADDSGFPPSQSGEFRDAIGYAGLRLTDGENTYYGWMQVAVTDYDNGNFTATLIDWAYEDAPGVGIRAGAIPEPPVSALLVGGAIAALAALRRKPSQHPPV